MNNGTLVYNVPSGTKHSFQINGVENTYINSTGITSTNITCNSIQFLTPSQSPNTNYNGYSDMTVLSALYKLQYGIYNNIINITLPNAGTYDCDISFPTNLVPSTTDASNIQNCISTNTTKIISNTNL